MGQTFWGSVDGAVVACTTICVVSYVIEYGVSGRATISTETKTTE